MRTESEIKKCKDFLFVGGLGSGKSTVYNYMKEEEKNKSKKGQETNFYSR